MAPDISYNSVTGSLTVKSQPFTTPTYSYNYNITPGISISNNIIQSGPVTNTLSLTKPAAQGFAIPFNNVLLVGSGGTTLFSTAFTKQAASSEIDVFTHVQASAGAITLFGDEVNFEILVDGNPSLVSIPHTLTANQQDYITLKAVFSGLSAGAHTVSVVATCPTGIAAFVKINASGYGGKLILKETY